MDLLTTLMASILILLAFQLNEKWILFGIVGLLILNQKSFGEIISVIILTLVLWALQSTEISSLWPAVLIGILIVFFLLGQKQSKGLPDYYGPEGGGLEGLMG
ncbi:MAG TPA: hypothetical protein VJK05_05020 [archaeon]|nr:hypothetical protein [archaeon]